MFDVNETQILKSTYDKYIVTNNIWALHNWELLFLHILNVQRKQQLLYYNII